MSAFHVAIFTFGVAIFLFIGWGSAYVFLKVKYGRALPLLFKNGFIQSASESRQSYSAYSARKNENSLKPTFESVSVGSIEGSDEKTDCFTAELTLNEDCGAKITSNTLVLIAVGLLAVSNSFLLVIFGIALLVAGKKSDNSMPRCAYVVFVLAAVVKVFVSDASVFDGLFRVLSFAVFGVVLIGMGYFYSRYIFWRRGE